MIRTKDIGSVFLERLPKGVREATEQAITETLQDGDIALFIEEHQPIMTADFIKRHITTFREYIKVRDEDVQFRPQFSLYGGCLTVIRIPRTKEIQLRIKKGIRTVAKYDTITEQYRDVTLKDYRFDMGNSQAIGFLKQFISDYSVDKLNRGMWLCGIPGVGKSMLMGAFAAALKKRAIGVCFYDLNQLITDIQTSMSYDGNKKNERLKELQECEVLILDDIGAEAMSAWTTKTVLYNTLNNRMSAKKATFFTSNLTKEEYFERLKHVDGNNRINDMDIYRLKQRIDSVAVQIALIGDDRRDKADDWYNALTADSVIDI